MNKSVVARTAPFVLFMAFIGLDEALRFFAHKAIITLSPTFLLSLYPVKALAVACVLVYFRSSYTEIRIRGVFNRSGVLLSLATGIAVFLLWINLDFLSINPVGSTGFDPYLFHNDAIRNVMIAVRMLGAVVIVPIMEELFWRSFLIRYIISPDFEKVAPGQFTWVSFLVTAILFGFEHNLVVAGIMAGVAYNLLLYKTRSVALCILAHAVTNPALGMYVLHTGKWHFW